MILSVLKRLLVLGVCALVLLVDACQQAATTAARNPATIVAASPWDVFVAGFLNDYFVAHPDFAASQGKHEFDGLLPDWSEDGLRREVARLEGKRIEVLAFKDRA